MSLGTGVKKKERKKIIRTYLCDSAADTHTKSSDGYQILLYSGYSLKYHLCTFTPSLCPITEGSFTFSLLLKKQNETKSPTESSTRRTASILKV